MGSANDMQKLVVCLRCKDAHYRGKFPPAWSQGLLLDFGKAPGELGGGGPDFPDHHHGMLLPHLGEGSQLLHLPAQAADSPPACSTSAWAAAPFMAKNVPPTCT